MTGYVGSIEKQTKKKRARMKLYTIYSPPNHPDKTVHKTKVEAEAAEKEKHY